MTLLFKEKTFSFKSFNLCKEYFGFIIIKNSEISNYILHRICIKQKFAFLTICWRNCKAWEYLTNKLKMPKSKQFVLKELALWKHFVLIWSWNHSAVSMVCHARFILKLFLLPIYSNNHRHFKNNKNRIFWIW